jgi:hypothetical protein
MSTAIEVWEGDGGAHRLAAPKIVPFSEAHRTLGMGVLYAMTIIAILVFVAKLH